MLEDTGLEIAWLQFFEIHLVGIHLAGVIESNRNTWVECIEIANQVEMFHLSRLNLIYTGGQL